MQAFQCALSLGDVLSGNSLALSKYKMQYTSTSCQLKAGNTTEPTACCGVGTIDVQGCSAAMPVRQEQADNRTLHLIDWSSRTAHASMVSAGLATSAMVTRFHGSARAVDALKWRIRRLS
jgi:hypothetical protein